MRSKQPDLKSRTKTNQRILQPGIFKRKRNFGWSAHLLQVCMLLNYIKKKNEITILHISRSPKQARKSAVKSAVRPPQRYPNCVRKPLKLSTQRVSLSTNTPGNYWSSLTRPCVINWWNSFNTEHIKISLHCYIHLLQILTYRHYMFLLETGESFYMLQT